MQLQGQDERLDFQRVTYGQMREIQVFTYGES
jgi:hypothetical protein